MSRRVILWGQYLAHIVEQLGSRVLVEYQHPDRRWRQSIWVDVSEVAAF
jgi:hypothetical protein